MSEEFIIKRRLLFDGEGTGDDKKINNLLKLLISWLLESDTNTKSDITYDALMAQLHSLIFNRKKSLLSSASTNKQRQLMKNLYNIYKERIELIRKDIVKQDGLLENAKITNRMYITYNLICQTIAKELPRRKLQSKIDILKREISELEIRKHVLGNTFNCKVKQCRVLSTSANNIYKELGSEVNDSD
ncbi:THO complex subunit 7 homolog [Sitophilus oryzae]|uniref:THO complex subunit 7 homolog n=1 Tax=Sitophilus oryzae TaxID=7048 RepID=A0A6J2YPQ5_SITOR|nr:THO complex subunit 7 homolog [Sitophilus oryzae]